MGKLYMVVGKWLLIRPEKSYLCHSLFTHTCSTSDVASFSGYPPAMSVRQQEARWVGQGQ